MILIRSLAATSLVALVSACSGGSGSANFGSELQFTNFSSVPDTGRVQLNGSAIQTTYTVDGDGNIVLDAPTTLPVNSVTILETESGDQVAITVDRDGTNLTIDAREGDRIFDLGGTFLYEAADGSSVVLLANPDTAGFEYQTFGSWVTGLTSTSGTAGAGSYGARTNTSGKPSPGTSATYAGASTGVASLPDGDPYATVSTVTVNTDFSTVSMTSNGTEGANLNSPVTSFNALPDLDFIAVGTVSGTGFNATVAGTTSSLTGTATGQFYGPAADEVGGGFTATAPNTNYIGAFGARQ